MIRLLAVALVLGGLAACGTETGNPEPLVFEYNATSSAPARVRLGDSTSGASVESVWLRLGDVSFVDCDGAVRGALPGIGFADHAGVEAALQAIELPDVPYCAVETVLFAEPAATGEPPAIEGRSVAIDGVLSDGRPFSVRLDVDVEIRIPLEQARLPTDGAWLLAFDVATWLDIESLESTLGDPVVVDSDNRPTLAADFAEATREAAQLWEDTDNDGNVGPSDGRID